jgi:hypothetical protein
MKSMPPDPGLGHEPGDQSRGVGDVELLAVEDLHRWPDPDVPAELMIEQCPEHGGRVEPRRAEPVDRPVGGDEGRGLKVTVKAVVGDERTGG